MNKLLFLLPVLLFTVPIVYGDEIVHSYDEVTTAQTTTSGIYVTIPDISLTSGNFTTGNKYLLIFDAQITGASSGDNSGIQSLHGSTIFTSSIFNHERDASQYEHYTWFTVWTAVSSEGVSMQFKSSGTVTVDQLSITAIEISEDLIEDTDWFFDSRTTTDVLSTDWFFVPSPSITFTPNGSDDWLVMANTQIDIGSVAHQAESRINFDNSTLTPLHSQEAEDAAQDRQMHFLARVFTPTASEHLIENNAREDGGGFHNRLYGSIFALNLDKFDVHSDSYIALDSSQDSGNSLGGTPTEENSVTISPNGSGDVFIMTFSVFDPNTTVTPTKIRQQVANSDQPPSQTTDNYNQIQTWDSTDQLFWFSPTMESLSSSTDIDMDTSTTTGTYNFRDNQIIAFTMELAGGSPTPPDPITDLTSTAITTTTVDLDWSEPDLYGESLIGYMINYTTPQSQTVRTTGIVFLNDTGTIDDTITGLTASTDYSATVSAWTIGGNNVPTANVYNFTTSVIPYSPSGKYIWFNVSPASNSTLGGIFAFECPSTQFVRGFTEDGVAICATP